MFGKLPRHGDFVARGLGDEARSAWDAWASGGIAGARAELGEAFDDIHASAPPWRFLLPPGPFGEGWLAGALAPSEDSAGRRFLLVLAIQGLTSVEAATQGAGLTARLEDALYDAIAQGLDADAAVALAQGVADAADFDPATGQALSTVVAMGPAGVWWTLGSAAAPPDHIRSASPPPDLITRALARPVGDDAT